MCQRLNLAAQNLLREWSSRSQRRNPAVMLDQAELPWFSELNRSLGDVLDAEGVRLRIRESTAMLCRLATEMADTAEQDYPGVDTRALREAIAAGPDLGGAPSSHARMLFAVAA